MHESLAARTRPFGGAFRDYMAPRTQPVSRAQRIVEYAVLAAMFALGPIAMVVTPLPPKIAAMYALFGAAIAILYGTQLILLQALGVVIYVLGIDPFTAALHARSMYDGASDVTGNCIVISAWVLVGFGPHGFLRAPRQLLDGTRKAPAHSDRRLP